MAICSAQSRQLRRNGRRICYGLLVVTKLCP